MADSPATTLVPFASLPSCAANCGPLYDANGACVPPAATDGSKLEYEQCFCRQGPLQGLTADPPADVCQGACTTDQQGYTSVRDWYTSLCNRALTATESAASSSTGTSNNSSGLTGEDWLSSHWKWVVMLIVIFVGIIVIWVGACIWRRKYLKKKERMYELGKHQGARTSGTVPWAPGSGVDIQHSNDSGTRRYGPNSSASPSQSQIPPANGENNGKVSKKSVVKERA